jgi:hypothetical protein
MDLSIMPQRLRKDWFHRYLLNPQLFRPGTRMPGAWPEGKSFRKDILDGNTAKQIDAIYQFLSDGRRAITPEGIVLTTQELVVGGEAVIYRNFIQDAGPRAIGVGYPEEVNLAFDADQLRLALLWQGRFMDGSRHWNGRGDGFQPPLGEKVIKRIAGAPLAVLAEANTPWPKEVGKEAGYQFRGYQLDELRRPTFFYRFGTIEVEEKPQGTEQGKERGLSRTISLQAAQPVDKLYYRAAAGGKIERLADHRFRIDDAYVIEFTLEGDAKPILRDSGGPELIVPLLFKDGKAQLVEQYQW